MTRAVTQSHSHDVTVSGLAYLQGPPVVNPLRETSAAAAPSCELHAQPMDDPVSTTEEAHGSSSLTDIVGSTAIRASLNLLQDLAV
jgi:hypothetical protein